MRDLKGDLIREDNYLLYAGLPIYVLYLKQIKIINDETIYQKNLIPLSILAIIYSLMAGFNPTTIAWFNS